MENNEVIEIVIKVNGEVKEKFTNIDVICLGIGTINKDILNTSTLFVTKHTKELNALVLDQMLKVAVEDTKKDV